MTAIDAAIGYPARRGNELAEGAQRVLAALLYLALFEMLLLPPPLLSLWTSYTEPGGGMPLAKIHFYSHTLLVALLFVLLCVGLVRFVVEQGRDRPGVLQFAVVIAVTAALTTLRQGVGGVAYMLDTLFAAPLVVMLASYLDQERRQRMTACIIWFVTFNALVGIGERIAGVHLFNIPEIDQFEYFRATAFMGHPLENGFITSSVMFLVPAMNWRASRKFLMLAICMAGILSFGARMSFLFSIMTGMAAFLFFGLRELGRGKLRLSILVAAPWIATLTIAAGAAVTFGTVLGERIVALAKFDESAQARVYAFKLFDYLSTSDLLYGVDFAEITFLLKIDKDLRILENCWIGILLMIGAILFVVFAVSMAIYLISMARGRSGWVAFAIVNFLLVASTSNSISAKTPSFAIFSLAMAGMARRERLGGQAQAPRHWQLQTGGAW